MVRITFELIARGTTLHRKKDEDDDSLMKRITHINLSGKKLVMIENLEGCTNLQCLYLYENRIQRIQNLAFAANLTHLYLQENNISVMDDLDALVNLRKLFLGGNALREITGLTHCTMLQELHVQAQRLNHNEPLRFDIDSLRAISDSLQVLNVQKNNITAPSVFRYLRFVEKLDLSMNNVESFDEVGALFSLDGCTNISSLEMKGNPVDKQHKFRDYVIMMAPSLILFNGREITQTERQFVVNREAAKIHARGKQDGEPSNPSGNAFDGVQVPPPPQRLAAQRWQYRQA